MKTIGLCTHFTETDEWAFRYAFKLAQTRQLQLNICHWLESPYKIRRDIVYNDLFAHQKTVPVTPAVLNKLELNLREYYEPKLSNFTNVAFKLCEGAYQVELTRCLRQHLMDMVVIGYQTLSDESADEQPLELFAMKLPYPVVIVGHNGADTFLINAKALEIRDQLDLPEGSWLVLEDANIKWQVVRPA